MASERGLVEHHQELGADAAQHRDSISLDRSDGCGGVESLGHHDRRTEQDRREVGCPQAEAERCGHQRHQRFVVGEFAVGDGEGVEVDPAVLEVQHALREPGRSRGRVDEAQVVGTDTPVVERRTGMDRGRHWCVVDQDRRVGLCLDDRHGDVTVELDAQTHQCRAEVRSGSSAVFAQGDERRCPSGTEQVSDLAVAGTSTDADGHDARLLQCQIRGMDRGAIGEKNRNTLARLDAERTDRPQRSGRSARRAPTTTWCPGRR